MIIQKVEATATVENATREAGQPNPEFSLVFDGLVNDETEPVRPSAKIRMKRNIVFLGHSI